LVALAGSGPPDLLPIEGCPPYRLPAYDAAAMLTEASLLIVYESRYRPPEKREQIWLDRQADKVTRGLAALEAAPPTLTPIPDVGQIALACLLGYCDLRFEGAWRKAHPKLVAWLDRFAAQVPAFAETKVTA